MAVKQMKTLGIAKQEFKRIRKQAKKKARKCPYGKSETTDGSEDDEEDTTTDGSGDGVKDCTTIMKENQCNNKWNGICSWNGSSCGSLSGGLGGVGPILGSGVSVGSVSGSSSLSNVQGKGNGNGGGKLKPNKPFKPDKQAGGGGQGQGGGKWGGNKPNKLDKPWGGNKPQGIQGSGSVIGKVKPNQGNQGGGSSSGESEDSEGTVTTEETEDSEETEESEDTSEDDGDEIDCSSAPKEMPCSKKGGGVCAWINGSCQPKGRHLHLRR